MIEKGYSLEDAKTQVDLGWAPLLDLLFGHLELNPRPNCYVADVKEKYGSLRISLYGGDEYLEGLVAGLELASTCICEFCGSAGTRRDGAWIKTLCDYCEEHK